MTEPGWYAGVTPAIIVADAFSAANREVHDAQGYTWRDWMDSSSRSVVSAGVVSSLGPVRDTRSKSVTTPEFASTGQAAGRARSAVAVSPHQSTGRSVGYKILSHCAHAFAHSTRAPQSNRSHRIRLLQRQHLHGWSVIVSRRRPDLTTRLLEVKMHAVFGILNSTPFTTRLDGVVRHPGSTHREGDAGNLGSHFRLSRQSTLN